jgi:hypothetical protein
MGRLLTCFSRDELREGSNDVGAACFGVELGIASHCDGLV